MTIPVTKNLVPQSKYSIKCPYLMDAEFITVHNTANDASAKSEVAYMVRNNNQVSYHFAIDDKEVVQGVPLNRNAWHCGDGGKGEGNRKSIGIEICYSKSGGDRYYKAEKLSIKFIAQLLHERKWGIDRVRSHKNWTEIAYKKGTSSYVKNCPHRIYDEGRWSQFLNEIQKELDKLNGKTNSPKPKTEGGRKLNLNQRQLKEIGDLYYEAYKAGIFSSKLHAEKVASGNMTDHEALYLLSAIIRRVHFDDKK